MAAPGTPSVGATSSGVSATVAPGAPASAGARQYAIVTNTVSTETWSAGLGPADTGWTLRASLNLTTPNANVPDRGNTARVEVWEQDTPGTGAISWTKSGTRRFAAVRVSWPGVVGTPTFATATQSSDTTTHATPTSTPPAGTDCKVVALAVVDQGPTPVTLTAPGSPWVSVVNANLPTPQVSETQSIRLIEQEIAGSGSPSPVSAAFTTSAVEESFLVSWVLPGTSSVGVQLLPIELGPSARLAVEIAWGADLNADPATWTWADVTAHVRQDPGISLALGRADEASTSQPASCTLVLDNTTGDYSLGGYSARYPNVRRNVPVRVRVNPGDGSGFRSAFIGFADGFTPGWDSLTGKIPVAELSASGVLRRIAQGTAPIQSAFRRAMANTSTVVAYWPFEEGKDAQYAANFRGGADATFTGSPDWASSDSFDCSDSLPLLKDAQFNAAVRPYAVTGEQSVRFLIEIPAGGLPAGTVLAHIHTTGTLGRFDFTYEAGASGSLGIFIYSRNGTLFDSQVVAFSTNGKAQRLSVEITQSGANVVWNMGQIEARPGSSVANYSETILSQTCGTISHIEIAPHGDWGDVPFGHLTVENDITSLFNATGPLVAFFRETVTTNTGRFVRLTKENRVGFTIYGTAETLTIYDQMGPQLVAPLLDLLHECESTDQGQLWDGRDAGLSYTTRRFRERPGVALTLDAALGHLAAPFQPTDDDQRTRNRVEARRLHGTTATFEDVTGPMGTAAIGIYDSSLEVNTAHDVMALQYAGWLVNLGTTPGYRFPTVSIDLRASPSLAAAVVDIIPGERIDLVNLRSVLTNFPAGTVSLIVEGISHEITAGGWTATFKCSPYSPVGVGVAVATTGDTLEGPLRPDTSGCTLSATYAAGVTAINVLTTAGTPLWTTLADDFPLTLDVGGLAVVATACSGTTTTQTFTVQALALGRAAGTAVKLYDPRPLGL